MLKYLDSDPGYEVSNITVAPWVRSQILRQWSLRSLWEMFAFKKMFVLKVPPSTSFVLNVPQSLRLMWANWKVSSTLHSQAEYEALYFLIFIVRCSTNKQLTQRDRECFTIKVHHWSSYIYWKSLQCCIGVSDINDSQRQRRPWLK